MEVIYRYDPYQPIALDHPGDAQAAAAALLTGNERFAQFVAEMQAATMGEPTSRQAVVPVDLVSMGLPLVAGVPLDQRPFALVLGCSDARVPIERVFDQSFNHLFVVRIAGNVLGTECLGSFDYAVRSFEDGLKLVVVLGHSGCGAVTAAVDAYLNPIDYAEIAFTHSLRSLLDRIMIAVRIAARGFEQCAGTSIRTRSGYREALIESAVYLNAAITSFDLAREAVSVRGMPLEVAYGVCDISTLIVRSAPERRQSGATGYRGSLGTAPAQPAQFMELAARFAETILAGTSLA